MNIFNNLIVLSKSLYRNYRRCQLRLPHPAVLLRLVLANAGNRAPGSLSFKRYLERFGRNINLQSKLDKEMSASLAIL